MKYVLLILTFVSAACSPAQISRIGPGVLPRPKGCDVEILEKGATPSRPYRDIGMVALENCQDYRTPPCRNWLADAVCELGGQVAYLSEAQRPDSQIGPVTFRVLVAAYVADLRPDVANDPVMQSKVCDPPCKEGEICKSGQCRPAEDCDKPEPVKKEPAPERCTE